MAARRTTSDEVSSDDKTKAVHTPKFVSKETKPEPKPDIEIRPEIVVTEDDHNLRRFSQHAQIYTDNN